METHEIAPLSQPPPPQAALSPPMKIEGTTHGDDLPQDLDELQARYLAARAHGQHETSSVHHVLHGNKLLLADWRRDPAFVIAESRMRAKGIALQLARKIAEGETPQSMLTLVDVRDGATTPPRDKISAAEGILNRGGLPAEMRPAVTVVWQPRAMALFGALSDQGTPLALGEGTGTVGKDPQSAPPREESPRIVKPAAPWKLDDAPQEVKGDEKR